MTAKAACTHLSAIESVKKARQYEREECVKLGNSWVHLRTCQTCGATLCCDSSPNRHATRHAQQSGHPVIASAAATTGRERISTSLLFRTTR